MKLAELLSHQLQKLAFPPLLLMVREMPTNFAYLDFSGWETDSFYCSKSASTFDICVCLSVVESEDALLKMSVPHTDSATPALPDFSRMTEDEQIAYALQMSMQGSGAGQTLTSILNFLN